VFNKWFERERPEIFLEYGEDICGRIILKSDHWEVGC
jgi:hypothetical protein